MTNYSRADLSYENGAKRVFHFRADSDGDKGVMNQMFGQRDYELAHFKMAAPLFKYIHAEKGARKPLILDAGANIGASVVYFSFKYPGCKIIAVEPEKNNFELLKLNGEELDVVPMEAAVGAEKGKLFLSDPGHSDWGFRVGEKGDCAVDVITIDSILAEFSEKEYLPFICKIDIEGGEANLFEKNYGWMDMFPVIIIELHDWLLPGQANSRNFRKALLDFDFDFVYRGENIFCFNNRLLRNFA